MAVPDTTTFSLQDVVDEVNPTTDDLVDCFADADSASFDAAYEESKDELDDFRNYGAVCVGGLTSFTVYPTNVGSGTACSGVGGTATYYHNGGSNPAANGDTVYIDAGGCNLMPSTGSNWVRFDNGGTHYRCQINGSGVITGRVTC